MTVKNNKEETICKTMIQHMHIEVHDKFKFVNIPGKGSNAKFYNLNSLILR